MSTADPEALLEAAISYARRGWHVIALAPNSKVTRKGTNGVHDATIDEATIRGWWAENPYANVGIACGMISMLLVLDVDSDPRKGKRGDEDMADLVAMLGKLPRTLEVLTPSGGSHLYFRHPGKPITSRAFGHVDVQADGFYVLAPPSVIPDGCYTWEVGRHG